LLLFNVTVVGAAVMAVLPERVSVTVTVLVGAALKRIDDVPLAPPARDNVLGVAVIDGVVGLPPAHAVPLSVNDAGVEFVVVYVALNPTLNVPLLAML
jgi:hypothetical protein